MENRKIMALVPLRGGSKSIPKKNIRMIAGKPLCGWVLEAALASNLFDKIVVSTDSDEIKDVVVGIHPSIEVLKRPAELATDTATTDAVMLHFAENFDFNVLVTIQATSPLLTAEDMRSAYKMFLDHKYDSLLTCVRIKRFFWTEDRRPINYDPLHRPMRQAFQGTLMENGAFYITKRETLDRHRCRLGGNIGIYEMAEETAVEIDDPADWGVVESLLLAHKGLKAFGGTR